MIPIKCSRIMVMVHLLMWHRILVQQAPYLQELLWDWVLLIMTGMVTRICLLLRTTIMETYYFDMKTTEPIRTFRLCPKLIWKSWAWVLHLAISTVMGILIFIPQTFMKILYCSTLQMESSLIYPKVQTRKTRLGVWDGAPFSLMLTTMVG